MPVLFCTTVLWLYKYWFVSVLVVCIVNYSVTITGEDNIHHNAFLMVHTYIPILIATSSTHSARPVISGFRYSILNTFNWEAVIVSSQKPMCDVIVEAYLLKRVV